MPYFVPHGPFIPDELVQALEEDRVVLFCGAGISMDAGLPNFKQLVEKTYDALGVARPRKRGQWLWLDRMLGELESKFPSGQMRKEVVKILDQQPATLDYHTALLRLARLNATGARRLVTTNFDKLFELAAEQLQDRISVDSGPVVPIPRNDKTYSWQSVVHLHGRLEAPPHHNDHLILTSADFGRAYLTDQWASRFIARLFLDFYVLFVGYSLNDPVLRYMTDAFAAEAAATRGSLVVRCGRKIPSRHAPSERLSKAVGAEGGYETTASDH